MTLDSICKVAFGVELGGISPDLPAVPFATAFDTAQSLLPKRTVDPLFRIKRVLNIGSERRFREAVDEVDLFAKNVITKRREEIAQAHNAGKEFVSFILTVAYAESIAAESIAAFIRKWLYICTKLISNVRNHH